jgi:DNA-binding transcriptional regulator GbsR (MarR family)
MPHTSVDVKVVHSAALLEHLTRGLTDENKKLKAKKNLMKHYLDLKASLIEEKLWVDVIHFLAQ